MDKHSVDLSRQHATPVRNKPDVARVDHGHKQLPFDLPVQMTVFRLLEDAEGNKPEVGVHSANLSGWELEIDCFTIPCQITVQIIRTMPYTLEVKIDDEVVRTIQRDVNKQVAHQEEDVIYLPGEEIVDDEIIDDEIIEPSDDYVFD